MFSTMLRSFLLIHRRKSWRMWNSYKSTYSGPKYLINDFTAGDLARYSAEEAALRCKLAALYRVVDLNGWSMGIYNHITARLPHARHSYLLNLFGARYDEVSASSLLTVDSDGVVLDSGSGAAAAAAPPAAAAGAGAAAAAAAAAAVTAVGVNWAGFLLHSAVHQLRDDLNCAIHVHVPEVIAVASMKCGLLPLSQEAIIVAEYGGGVTYHDYQGILFSETECADIQRQLGPTSKVLFLRNHGVLVGGATVEEAFLLLDFLVLACRSQVAMMAAGVDGLTHPHQRAAQRIAQMRADNAHVDTGAGCRQSRHQFGQLEFEAWMRRLDALGLQTGYHYQRPELVRPQLDC